MIPRNFLRSALKTTCHVPHLPSGPQFQIAPITTRLHPNMRLRYPPKQILLGHNHRFAGICLSIRDS